MFFAGSLRAKGTAEAVFREADLDGDGRITLEELQVAARKALGNLDLSKARVETLMRSWDADGDGAISLVEFKKMIRYMRSGSDTELREAWGLIGEIQDGHAFYWLDSLKANMASTCSAQASHDKVAARLERLDDLEMGPVGPVTKGQGPLTLGLKHVRARF